MAIKWSGTIITCGLVGVGVALLEKVCHYGDILVKNVSAFCSCMESLPETKVKSFGLILLTEEI